MEGLSNLLQPEPAVHTEAYLRIQQHRRQRVCGMLFSLLFLSGMVCAGWVLLRAVADHSLHSAAGKDAPYHVSVLSSGVSPQVYDSLLYSPEQMCRGELILVNRDAPCADPDDENGLVRVYDEKNRSYKVRDLQVYLSADVMEPLNRMLADFEAATGRHDVMVLSGYRTLEYQQELYQARADRDGEEAAAFWVAAPGHSEHHTGLALDFSIYSDSGVSGNFTGKGSYAWLLRHAPEYGFVLRYPKEKSEQTGFGYEPWHFRYLGTPHAALVTQLDFCLEEYLDYLRQFPADGAHLTVCEPDGTLYEIYFVPSAGDQTRVPVPTTGEWRVSGNNVDGFVVTVRLPG